MTTINSYSPTELFALVCDSIRTYTDTILTVKGIYRQNGRKAYGGMWYDSLCDEAGDQTIALRIPSTLRETLKDNSLLSITGVLTTKMKEGGVELALQVTRTETLQEQVISEDTIRRMEIRNLKVAAGYHKVDILLQNILLEGRKPRVALVYADTSITDADFDQGIRASQNYFDFEEHRVPFTQTERLVRELKTISASRKCDALCIIRGGGTGLETLESPALLEAVATLGIPVVAAVGHTKDNVFINEISDHVCGTPSLLGQWFKTLTETVTAMKTGSGAAIAKETEARFTAQIKSMQESFDRTEASLRQQLRASTRRNAITIAVAAAAVIISILL